MFSAANPHTQIPANSPVALPLWPDLGRWRLVNSVKFILEMNLSVRAENVLLQTPNSSVKSWVVFSSVGLLLSQACIWETLITFLVISRLPNKDHSCSNHMAAPRCHGKLIMLSMTGVEKSVKEKMCMYESRCAWVTNCETDISM